MKVATLPVVSGSKGCLHSLAVTYVKGRSVQRFALPCVVKHKPTTRNPKHRDAEKRTW